jgi:hypothetical protein
MICKFPTDVCTRNLRQKAEQETGTIFVPDSHERLASRKCIMCARNIGAHVRRGTRSNKGKKKWDEKLNSRAAEKGAKKLVSSNCAKILE